MHGWTGRILKIDLCALKTTVEPINIDWAHSFIGGRGLAAKYLCETLSKSPEEAENLVMMTGPLTGLFGPSSNRCEVCAVSPFTGKTVSGGFGGHFGAELKKAGYDGMIISGTASHPVMIVVKDGNASIVPAADVWGKNIGETFTWIKQNCGADYRSVVIGRAGENKSPYAVITADGIYTAGAGGIGALFGSKNLKGISVRGTGAPEAFKVQKYFENALQNRQKLLDEPMCVALGAGKWETVQDMAQNIYSRPLDDYRLGAKNADWTKDTGAGLIEVSGRFACFSCPVGCRVGVRITKGPWQDDCFAPAYEDAHAFLSGLCGITRPDVLIRVYELCREYGLDKSVLFVIEKSIEPCKTADAEAIFDLIKKAGDGQLSELYTPASLPQADIESLAPYMNEAPDGRGVFGFTADLYDASAGETMDGLAFIESCGICPFAAAAIDTASVAESLFLATGLSVSEQEAREIGCGIRHLDACSSAF